METELAPFAAAAEAAAAKATLLFVASCSAALAEAASWAEVLASPAVQLQAPSPCVQLPPVPAPA